MLLPIHWTHSVFHSRQPRRFWRLPSRRVRSWASTGCPSPGLPSKTQLSYTSDGKLWNNSLTIWEIRFTGSAVMIYLRPQVSSFEYSPAFYYVHPPYTWTWSCLCWTRQVFKDAQGSLDMDGKFSPLYRQDSSKISTDDLIKMLADIRKWVINKTYDGCDSTL